VRSVKKEVDAEFNHLMLCDVRLKIAEAFINLESNIRSNSDIVDADSCFKELVEKKASQMKNELGIFIDSQTERIINSLKH